MTSLQCHKPSDQTNHHHVECHKPSDSHHQKTDTCHDKSKTSHNDHSITHKVKEMFNHHDNQKSETCHDKNKNSGHNDHSLTHKVKDMFTHHDDHGHVDHNHGPDAVPHQTHTPKTNCLTGIAHSGAKTEKTNKMKKTDGHGGHCMPKVYGGHLNKKKNNKEGKHSDSGSSSDSENEKCNQKKVCCKTCPRLRRESVRVERSLILPPSIPC